MAFCKFSTIAIILMHTLALTLCSAGRTGAIFRVVGGSVGSISKFPWQVSVQLDSHHWCGGTIISSRWIVSAAHCTDGKDLNSLSVRVGSSFHGVFGNVVNISRVVDHPKYSAHTFDYDVSLIQLSETLHFDEKVQPIALPDANTEIADGTVCMATGWGNTQNSDESNDFLRKVPVPIISNDECNEVLHSKITPQMICAGYIGEGGKDSCTGDSGGPMRCYHTKNDTETLLLIGVVSWGYGCGEKQKPGVYTRVTSVRKWIEIETGI